MKEKKYQVLQQEMSQWPCTTHMEQPETDNNNINNQYV